jgi:hypothetical protein
MGISFAGLIIFVNVLFTKQYRYLFTSFTAFLYGFIWTARTMPQFSSQLVEHAYLLSVLDFVFLLLLVGSLVAASVSKKNFDLLTLIFSGLTVLGKIVIKIYSSHILRVVYTLDNSDIFSYMQRSSNILMLMEHILIIMVFLTLFRIFIRMKSPQ